MHAASNKPNFIHLQLPVRGSIDSKRATVAYRIVESRLCWGIAICNPEDRYVRKEGRERSTTALEERPNSIELSVLKTLAVGVTHNLLLAKDVGSPLSMVGVMAATEALSVALDNADDTYAMLSTEFLERCILRTLNSISARSQWIGNLVFDLSHFG